jgi:hypothetical protein
MEETHSSIIKLPADAGQLLQFRFAAIRHMVSVLEREAWQLAEAAAGQKLDPKEWTLDVEHAIIERVKQPEQPASPRDKTA